MPLALRPPLTNLSKKTLVVPCFFRPSQAMFTAENSAAHASKLEDLH